jgi:hypothetical protein
MLIAMPRCWAGKESRGYAISARPLPFGADLVCAVRRVDFIFNLHRLCPLEIAGRNAQRCTMSLVLVGW